ncbi:MAG: hypothetical protein R3B68_01700 [Phycisphaerales bacterium]
MRRVRFIAVRVIGLALLGAATSVGVAWGLAAWLPNARCARSYSDTEHAIGDLTVTVWVAQFERPGLIRRQWREQVEPDWGFYMPPPPVIGGENVPSHEWAASKSVGEWGWVARARANDDSIPDYGFDDARGWPMPCLWYAVGHPPSAYGTMYQPQPSLHGGTPLSFGGLTPASDIRALPLIPIWRGLAINTAFYALVWAVVVYALIGLRLLWRRRRGLCPRCGYDVERDWESGCPECGWGRARGCGWGRGGRPCRRLRRRLRLQA